MSWAGGAFLAALAGILITPIQGTAMSANALTLLVIDAFAAAMFGRLKSLPRTFVGAIVLGLLDQLRHRLLPGQQVDLDRRLPLVDPDDPAVRRSCWSCRRTGSGAPPCCAPVSASGCRRCATPGSPGWCWWSSIWALRTIMATTAINTLAYGITLGIIALSLVLLTGYAGEINLAALSFGAIGTIVVFHFGISGTGNDARMTLWGILLRGHRLCASWERWSPCPPCGCEGLYLALATMAFGVFVSRHGAHRDRRSVRSSAGSSPSSRVAR